MTRPAFPPSALAVLALLLTLVLSACGGSAPGKAKGPAGAPGSTGTVGGSASAEPPAPPEPRFGVPKAGQCHQMGYAQSKSPVFLGAKVPCRKAHTSLVIHAGVVDAAVTAQTPVARRRAVARKVCEPAFRRLVGGTPALRATSLLTWVFFTPSAAELARGARWVRCDAIARSARELVALPATTPLLRKGLPEQLRVCQDNKGVDVSCARPHQFRVEAVFLPSGNAYPGQAFTSVARDRCRTLMNGALGYWQPPSRAGWAAGDHYVRCLARTS
ncbi:MAG: septum formation family protein [Marmoricola sp.]